MMDLHPPGAFDIAPEALAHGTPPPKADAHLLRGSKYYYDDATLVGTCTLDASDFDPTTPAPYGLTPMYQGWYAYVRDPSGTRYYAQRVLQGPMVPRLDLSCTAGRVRARDVPEAADSFTGYVHVDTRGGRWNVVSLGSPKRPRMSFRLDPGKEASWAEEGLCQLEFESLGPAMQTYHPDPVFSMYWRQLVYVVRGTILGQDVVGVGGVEQAWGNGGLNWMDLPMYQRVEDQWVLSVLEYADGRREVASMFTSLDGKLGAGIQIDGSSARAIAAPQSDFDLGDDGQPSVVRWCFGDALRETVLTTGTMASPRTPGHHVWQCGTTRPADTGADIEAEVAWSFAFVESVPRAVDVVRTRAGARS